MAIHNPPFYRYALFEDWDKEAFELIKEVAGSKNYPRLKGSAEDKDQYLTILIRTQKSLHDWRDLLKDTLTPVKELGTIDAVSMCAKYTPGTISNDVPDWVTYEEDKIVNTFIDELGTRPVHFDGSDEEISEFIIRFILGQLGHDWELTILMIWEMLGGGNLIAVKKLNDEMRHFDYLGIFE